MIKRCLINWKNIENGKWAEKKFRYSKKEEIMF